MNAHQRRLDRRTRIQRVKWLVATDPTNHDAIYRAILKLRFADLPAIGVTKIELVSKE
jgi:hypothetical protein